MCTKLYGRSTLGLFKNMKSSIAILLLAGVLTLTSFSFLVMGHDSQNSHSCAAVMASNTACPPLREDSLAYINFHVDFLKSFTVTIVGSLMALTILTVVLVLEIIDTSQTKRHIFSPTRYWPHYKEDPLPLNQRLYAWLALHETSPTY